MRACCGLAIDRVRPRTDRPAHLLRNVGATGEELLFVSEEAVFNGKKAIRGGIPLVFPQFGPGGAACCFSSRRRCSVASMLTIPCHAPRQAACRATDSPGRARFVAPQLVWASVRPHGPSAQYCAASLHWHSGSWPNLLPKPVAPAPCLSSGTRMPRATCGHTLSGSSTLCP